MTLLSGQQPARDSAAPGPTGTATVAGVVVTDDAAGRPIRKALVSLTIQGRGGSANTVVTDDQGRFTFNALAAGRYMLSAAKPSYVNAAYGSPRAGRPGTPLQISDSQAIGPVTLKMAHGSVVTGTVVDQAGQPVPSARVRLMRYVFSAQTGERTLQAFGAADVTDDRGVYRIFGVAPGEYVAQLNSPFSLPGDLRQTTEQSMQAAMQQMRSGGVGPGSSAPPVDPAPTVGYTALYYPGTPSPASATTIKLGVGDERTNIDIQFQMVPTARIEGFVFLPDGAPAPNAQVTLLDAGPADMNISGMLAGMFGAGRPGADGKFTLSGITPGHYAIAARTGVAAAGRAGGPLAGRAAGAAPVPGGPVLWALSEVDINGQDVTGVRLTLEPGMSLAGRVEFEGNSERPKDLTTVRVAMNPILSGNSVAAVVQPVPLDAQGAFSFSNVTPGRYRLSTVTPIPATPASATTPPGSPTAWILRSARVKGRDTLDSGIEVRPNENVADALLTFSDRPTSLTGTLQDASGRAASDYFIVVYAADKSFWAPPSRRVSMTRPASDGKFTVRDLPPGDYLIAATTDIEPGEWMDPAFLTQLVTASIKVALAEGETKVQDIRIAR